MSLNRSNHPIDLGPDVRAAHQVRSPSCRKSTGRPAHQELEP